MNFILALIELPKQSVVFGVAGWLSYLATEKGAAIGGGAGADPEDEEFCAGADPEDEEFCATPAQSDAE